MSIIKMTMADIITIIIHRKQTEQNRVLYSCNLINCEYYVCNVINCQEVQN